MFRVVCRHLLVNGRLHARNYCRFEVTRKSLLTSKDNSIEAKGYRELQILTKHQKQQVSASILVYVYGKQM